MWPLGIEYLYLVETESNNWQILTDKFLTSESVSWSPDGKQIALWNEGLLCIKNLETMTEVCPLTNISPFDEFIVSFDTRPIWSADGDWAAFYAINMPCMMIYFLELETNSAMPGDLGCDVTEISEAPRFIGHRLIYLRLKTNLNGRSAHSLRFSLRLFAFALNCFFFGRWGGNGQNNWQLLMVNCQQNARSVRNSSSFFGWWVKTAVLPAVHQV
ncbi:MAG: hypothetical protein M5U34_35265 [Chloroflexi bacterium]|nr:hypothetical protein [Chloroflexota bacterium]